MLFFTQIYCAVDGKIWVNPIAPAEDFALELNPLSVLISAQNKWAEISNSAHTFRMSFSYFSGYKKVAAQQVIIAPINVV